MTVPPVVAQVAEQTAKAERGVVSATYERVFRVQAGPAGRTDHLVFKAVYRDGTLVSAHITEDTIGGTPATAAQRAKTESQYVHPLPGDAFRRPWDPGYLGEYRYRVVDPVTIAFTSLVNDTAHGSGTFVIDGHANVVRYQYAMSANLAYRNLARTTQSSISGKRTEVLPGYWAVTHEVQQYAGRYQQVPGSATTEITQSGFARVPG